MLSKRHVVVCDGCGSISSGRFIFLAVISSHDPSHVAHRLEFYFHGSLVCESRAEALTDRNYKSCPRAPDSWRPVKSGEEGVKVGVYRPRRAVRHLAATSGAVCIEGGHRVVVGATGGASYWLAVRRSNHAIGPLSTSWNRTGGGVDEPGRSTGAMIRTCGSRAGVPSRKMICKESVMRSVDLVAGGSTERIRRPAESVRSRPFPDRTPRGRQCRQSQRTRR